MLHIKTTNRERVKGSNCCKMLLQATTKMRETWSMTLECSTDLRGTTISTPSSTEHSTNWAAFARDTRRSRSAPTSSSSAYSAWAGSISMLSETLFGYGLVQTQQQQKRKISLIRTLGHSFELNKPS